MVGIIVTGHGEFPSGILSALKLLAGMPEDVIGVDFLEGYSTEDLKEKLEEAMYQLGNEILILTDIKGGTPYNASAVCQSEIKDKKIEVIAGMNLPMLILATLEREGQSLDEVVQGVLVNGKDGIEQFQLKVPEHDISQEDGI